MLQFKWVNSTYFLITFILLLGIFFRSYEAVERFDFAHDGDLYSWIIKDIVINHHFRLIGQETSSEGIFIGPLFYYALIPFFALSSFDPVGGLVFVVVLGTLTIFSFYFIFKNLFNKAAGLIAAFLQAIMITRVNHDRWLVPTITTNLWEVWFFYVIVKLTRGDFSVFFLLGILIGLMWHINLSEAPLLILIPIAILLSKKIPKLKDLKAGLIGLILPSVPLIIFEFKHNFIQTKSFLLSFITDQGGGKGYDKLIHVLQQVSGNTNDLFFYPYRDFYGNSFIPFALLLLIPLLLTYLKIIDKKITFILFFWLASMIGFFSFSSKIISEYYFSNIDMVFLAFFIILLTAVFNKVKFGKTIIILFLTVFLIRNGYFLISKSSYNLTGYFERKAAVEYIYQDAKQKGYPCVAISYIASPGNNVGFRYLFYLHNLIVNHPPSEGPVYTIVIPYELAKDSILARFGNIGLIPPETNESLQEIQKSCGDKNSNLTDPLFGYVQ